MNEELIQKIQNTFCGCGETDCGKDALESVLEEIRDDLVGLCEDNQVMADVIRNYFNGGEDGS